MTVFVGILMAVEVIVALLLIVIILLQRSKAGGGLGGLATNNAGMEEAFGSSAGNILSKATVWLSVLFLVNTLAIGMIQQHINKRNSRDIMAGVQEEKDKDEDKKGDKPDATKPDKSKPEEGKTDGDAGDKKPVEGTDTKTPEANDKAPEPAEDPKPAPEENK